MSPGAEVMLRAAACGPFPPVSIGGAGLQESCAWRAAASKASEVAARQGKSSGQGSGLVLAEGAAAGSGDGAAGGLHPPCWL